MENIVDYRNSVILLLAIFIIFKLSGSPTITSDDFKAALEGFTPAALRGVTLHTSGELGWSDVGGLAAVKEALMETLLWPTKVFIY